MLWTVLKCARVLLFLGWDDPGLPGTLPRERWSQKEHAPGLAHIAALCPVPHNASTGWETCTLSSWGQGALTLPLQFQVEQQPARRLGGIKGSLAVEKTPGKSNQGSSG